MKQAHKKRPPRATANSPPGLPDIGKLLYKSCIFLNFFICLIFPLSQTHYLTYCSRMDIGLWTYQRHKQDPYQYWFQGHLFSAETTGDIPDCRHRTVGCK